MNYRRWTLAAEWLLVAAIVLLHVGLFLVRPREPGVVGARALTPTWSPIKPLNRGDNIPLEALADALPMCQAVLLAAIVAAAPGRARFRVLFASPLVALWGLAWLWPMDFDRNWREWVFRELFLLEIAAVALLGFSALRLSGWRVARVDPFVRPAPSQFSLTSLLVVTAMAAALLGGLHWLRPALRSPWDAVSPEEMDRLWEAMEKHPPVLSFNEVRFMVIVVLLAAAGCVSLWGMLRPRGAWLWLAGIAAGVPVASGYVSYVAGVQREFLLSATLNLSVALWSVAALVCLTAFPAALWNYRFVHCSRKASP